MCPPDCRTMPYTVARPSPVPLPTSLVVKNGSNRWALTSSVMPEPVSPTVSTTYGPGLAACQLAEAVNDCQQVIEVVGHAPGQPPHGLHLLRLAQLFLRQPQGRLRRLAIADVPAHAQPAGHPALLQLGRGDQLHGHVLL